MRSIEEILFKYLKEIVNQIYITKIGTSERYLQCLLFSKIYNHKSDFHKWSHVDVEKYFRDVGKKPCDLYFEQETPSSNNKAIWAEKKFLTYTGNKSPGYIQTSLIRDFLRLLFYPKPNSENYDIENYVIMVARCDYDVESNTYYDPRRYFGILSKKTNHPELSKLIFPEWEGNINFDIQMYLSKLNSTTIAYKDLLKDFPELRTLDYIHILKYSFGSNPIPFDENTDSRDLEDHVYGYLYKILSYQMLR